MLSTPISHNVLKKTSAVNEEESHIADNIQDVPHDWFPWHLNRNVEFHDMKFNLSKKTTLKNWAIFSSFRFSLFWKVKNLYSLRLPTHPDLPNPLLLFCFFPHNNALLQQEVSPHFFPMRLRERDHVWSQLQRQSAETTQLLLHRVYSATILQSVKKVGWIVIEICK